MLIFYDWVVVKNNNNNNIYIYIEREREENLSVGQ